MCSARANPQNSPPNTPLGRYWAHTHRPLECLAFVAPFVIIYEVGVALAGTDLLARHQLGSFLAQLGGSATYLPAMLVAVVLLGWQLFSREPWKLSTPTLVAMFLESLLWALPLLGLGMLDQRMAMSAREAAALPANFTQDLLAGIGGGVYEEFLFRLAGLNLVTLLLIDVFEMPKDWGFGVAIAACSTLFSLYHFWGSPFDVMLFVFYGVAGVYLAGVFLMRGFGVSVGTHVFYNVLVVSMRLLF